MLRSRSFAVLLIFTALTLPAPVGPALAQSIDLVALVNRHTDEAIELRHRIHQNPELGNREHETAALVAEYLRSIPLDDVRTGVAYTGVVGVLRGGLPGPVVAIRADMDALPVTEETGLPFASTKRAEFGGQEVGVMHACGHDIHTVVGLATASVLADMKNELPGTVLFIFQPAEEGPPPGENGGARMMLEEGVFDDPKPEAIFALHALPSLEVGELGFTPGPVMAAADRWTVRIIGRQAHGAHPEESVDPVVTAAQVVIGLQTIRSRSLSAIDAGVLTTGIIRGGERNNIIPGEAYLEGTVRTYDPAVQNLVERRIQEVIQGITASAGATYEFNYERQVPVTVNDVDLGRQMLPTLERVVGTENVHVLKPTGVAEDFAYFAQTVPGFYFRLGTTKPGTTSGGLHTPTMIADDSAIPVGVEAMTALVLDYLGR
ncbi:MAG TPA: amidohydrolase [Thermomicrobiales bacterium]|nr:amidohydrolase [Thermomicrobiales bacterium]